MWSTVLTQFTDQWVIKLQHIKHDTYEDEGQTRHCGGYYGEDWSVKFPRKR